MEKKCNYFWFGKPDLNFHRLIMTMIISCILLFCGIRNITAIPSFSLSAENSVSFKNSTYENPPEISSGMQQQKQITGTVTDAEGKPLTGVTITIKGTTLGSLSDASGKYILTNVPKDATLVFSFIGMKTQEIPVGTLTTINVTMSELSINLDEIVVVGYGTQKKTSLTSAVSTVKGDEIKRSGNANIASALSGNISGITVNPANGLPGATPVIHVRGLGTTGNANPLIVIDGITRDNLSQIDPSIIESVTVLKDAAAVAPFGMGGANGVILITTKRGNNESPTITFSSYYGLETPTWLPKTLNAVDYMKLKNEAGSGNYSNEYLNNYPSLHASDPDKYPDANPGDLIKDRYTPVQNYNIKMSGGSEKTKFFVGGGYFGEKNLFPGIYYKRYNYNANIDSKVTKTTTVSVNIIGSFERSNDLYPGKPGGGETNRVFRYSATPAVLLRDWYKQSPNDPMMFSNGKWAGDHGVSFPGLLNSNSYNKGDITTLLNTITVEQQLPFIEGLSLKGSFSYDLKTNFVKGFGRPIHVWNVDYTTTPYTFNIANTENEGMAFAKSFLNEDYTRANSFTYQGYVNYKRTFGNHDVSFTGVAELQKSNYYRYYASKLNYIVDIDEFDMGSSDKQDFSVGGNSGQTIQLGYVYRMDYAYKNKYLAEATGRYDGSYFFAPGKRFAYFPAFSLGWRLSEESFMKSITFINNLKIRASWGKTGIISGNAYQYLAGYYLSANSYAFGSGTMYSGAGPTIEANPIVTWEKSTKSNIGFDATLWNSLLNIEADYFFEKRDGMLLAPSVTVPVEYGIGLANENAGKMENHGIELTLSSKHKFQNGLALTVQGNVSYAKNKMTQVFETDATYNNPNRRRTGRPYQTPFGYHALGLFSTADDKNADGIINAADGYNVQQFGDLHPGDIKYADISGPKGVPDGIIDNNDEVSIGYPIYPQIIYGFSTNVEWKGFDLNLFFQGTVNSSINVNGNFITCPFLNDQSNTDYEYFNNRWTPEHQNAKYPRATVGQSANNNVESDFWYHKRDYLRLKNLVLGYSIPEKITKSIGISNLRVYFSGTNVFTLSKLKFTDPELTYPGGQNSGWTLDYPPVKMYFIGVNVTF